ncbi:HEAT repeat domain-containing protein [Natrinema salinisoli]|uniref:HEAT repeat domain-containing protein n=1 Tax=Natrinema salinisoli TaxID=2878535 RepID=UPI001CF03277|nr:HEAT repeat domain-containing protein [Natrinema salinisoli]
MTDHTNAPDDPAQRVDYLRETVDPATATDADIDAWCELLTDYNARTDADEALGEIAKESPDGVRRVAEGLHPYFVHETKRVWEIAADILTWLSLVDPDALDITVDFLREHLDADDEYRREAAWSVLGKLADVTPELVRPHVDEIIEYLDHDDAGLQSEAIGMLGRLSDTYPEAIASAGDDLLAITRDESVDASALPGPLTPIALVRPDIVRPVVENLRDTLAAEAFQVRIRAASSLATIPVAYPDERSLVIDDLLLLAEEDSGEHHTDLVRGAALNSLRNLAIDDPDAVVPELPRVRDHLDDESRLVREAAVDILGSVATERPTEVRSNVEDLLALLADEDEHVQLSAVRALGKLAAADATVAPRVVEAVHEWFDRAEK